MLNMDQYGSTYKKCDVHHIIGIKLQDTRAPPPGSQVLLIQRAMPHSNSESMKYPCPARVVSPWWGGFGQCRACPAPLSPVAPL